jgi:TonB family protein
MNRRTMIVGVFALMFTLSFAIDTVGQTVVPLKVKKMPKARPPEVGACKLKEGIATIRVTFDKGGKVTDREVVTSSGCDPFDENARNAAKNISFTPQTEDGSPVTVIRNIQFRYIMR